VSLNDELFCFHSAVVCLKRTLTTSFGSVCFGALVTSVLSTLELSIVFLLPCCLVDLFLRYVNRYSLVQVATFGKTYVQSARSVVRLLRLYGLESVANDNCLAMILFSFCSVITFIVSLLTVAGAIATGKVRISISQLELEVTILTSSYY